MRVRRRVQSLMLQTKKIRKRGLVIKKRRRKVIHLLVKVVVAAEGKVIVPLFAFNNKSNTLCVVN